MIFPQRTLNCGGILLDLETPRIMGIINVTPDSFFAASRASAVDAALRIADRMLAEGADILDIGGMSSRPGATIITPEEECARVIPVIAAIHQRFSPCILSIDTVHSTTAAQAVAAGASIINDISAGRIDPQLYATVADLQVPYILMHMQGVPGNMQQQPHYENVTLEVLDFFIQEIYQLRQLGVKDIVIDPGFGFGKTLDHNYQLLRELHLLGVPGVPLLAGISRKSMIYKLLDTVPDKALNGTTALNMVALQQGARILRVHDVREAREVVLLWQQLEPA
ncbi:MAG: dihydropteroate synthase [Saprospiraceae bacterium]